ncbi:RHS repeat-associated core domain-containing protein [Pseudomonas luteola]|uniref:RHS repeat-associated core domain-containing protein n=1 Tax=Pseudomonas TaxID=286 RepID=UPI003890769B
MSPDNRLKAWKDLRLTYDAWGNVSERHSSSGYQRFTYDCENRLVKAETYRGHDSLSQASYEYDCLGRRIAKHVLTEEKTETTRFLWQGLRMLQEQKADLYSLYIYEQGSYAPLARLDTDPSQPDQKPKRYYFHTDQIGTPLEVTDDTGRMVWRAYYKTWGALEALVPREIEQNLRFQGQYYDAETGLHYNTFRYYDPAVGRFTAQDPIGLLGGINLYNYGDNPAVWIDPTGLTCSSDARKLASNLGPRPIGGGQYDAHHIIMSNSRDWRMVALRKKMEDLGIDINYRKNGIWLPNTSKARVPGTTTTAHKGEGVHSNIYKQYVYDKLINTADKKSFLTELSEIKSSLNKGMVFNK